MIALSEDGACWRCSRLVGFADMHGLVRTKTKFLRRGFANIRSGRQIELTTSEPDQVFDERREKAFHENKKCSPEKLDAADCRGSFGDVACVYTHG